MRTILRTTSPFLLAICISSASLAQVTATYTFTPSTGIFTSLPSGVAHLWSGNSMDDDQPAAVAIPAFTFNEQVYNEVFVSVNGFITFGSAPAANNYTPLSSSAAYSGAIAAFGTDLQARQTQQRDVRYAQVDDEFVIEWRGVRRKAMEEGFNFQIKLNTITNVISIVYGGIENGPDELTSLQPQVGLRGPNNYNSNVLNRKVGTGAETWSNSLNGTSINDEMRFTTAIPAKAFSSGLTYTYTPSVCPSLVTIEFQNDQNATQNSWEILDQGSMEVVCSGGNYPNNSTITENCCLADGCYVLHVYDSAGDGMASGNNGGYILRTTNENERIIDNRNNFLNGSISAIANNGAFCLPLGDNNVLFAHRDKLDWVNDQFIVASLDPAVSAEWIPNAPNSAQDANSGYQFWFFDPNGSYSFIWFRRHSNSHGFGEGAARAAHLRINNWLATYHIPEGVLMNVRVRGVVNGMANEWGPASRFKIDPAAALCPMTKLNNIPGHQYMSCGEYREFSFNSYVYALPVSGASQYQFRFRQPAEGFEKIRTTSSYIAQLWWTLSPLVSGSQYEVDVRAYKNGQWCPWGEVCTLNIGTPNENANFNVVAEKSLMEGTASFDLNIWPNPNPGHMISIGMEGVPASVSSVDLEMFDLFGKKVMHRTLIPNSGTVSTIIDMDNTLSQGVYLMNFTIGDQVRTSRLVIQR